MTAPAKVSYTHLEAGQQVVTSEIDGDDFGLPLVSPTTREVRNRVVREVRGKNNGRVWFTDGTKTRKMHGRTSFVVAEAEPA